SNCGSTSCSVRSSYFFSISSSFSNMIQDRDSESGWHCSSRLERQRRLERSYRDLELRIIRFLRRDVLQPEPGAGNDRQHQLGAAPLLADALMISYDAPAMNGISRIRVAKLSSSESNRTTENVTMATSITSIRKLVPHRGCWRGLERAFSTVSSSPASHT